VVRWEKEGQGRAGGEGFVISFFFFPLFFFFIFFLLFFSFSFKFCSYFKVGGLSLFKGKTPAATAAAAELILVAAGSRRRWLISNSANFLHSSSLSFSFFFSLIKCKRKR